MAFAVELGGAEFLEARRVAEAAGCVLSEDGDGVRLRDFDGIELMLKNRLR